MTPLLAQIGTVFVYTYGVFLALGFFWSCFLLWKHIRISKFSEDLAFDVFFISFAGSLLVGRLLYGFLHFKEFGLSLMRYILVNGYPGMSVLGMIVGWFLTMYLIAQNKKIRFEEYVDYTIPSVFVFMLTSQIGSFFAGLEPGIRWGWFQHPVALYRMLFATVGLSVSIRLLFDIRKEKVDKGFTAIFFIWLFSLSHVVLRPLKDARVLLSDSQVEFWVFAILLLTSSFYIVYYFRVFVIGMVKSFINWNVNYVKTAVKVFPHKTKELHRGGAKENNSTN